MLDANQFAGQLALIFQTVVAQLLCVAGGRLVLNRYSQGKDDQEWARNGSLITSLFEHHMVLDIFGKKCKLNELQFNCSKTAGLIISNLL